MEYLKSNKFVENFIESHPDNANSRSFAELKSRQEALDKEFTNVCIGYGLGWAFGIGIAEALDHSSKLKENEQPSNMEVKQ